MLQFLVNAIISIVCLAAAHMAAKTPMTIPIKLLHEGVGNNVTVELKSGEIYRGFLEATGMFVSYAGDRLVLALQARICTIAFLSQFLIFDILNSEDNMNCQVSSVTMTQKDGRVARLQNVYLRGSQIRFVVLPDILKNAPIFKRVQQIKQTYDKKKNPNARSKR